MTAIHTPVLINETLNLLSPNPDAVELMYDSTLGEGGHSEAFLRRCPHLYIIGIDRDREQIQRANERLAQWKSRVETHCAWFDDFYGGGAKREKADIVLFDLGISMFHYACSGRGFSFDKDEPLDMRLDPSEGQSAADIVSSMREDKLADLIYNYSEERYSRRIARAIVEARTRFRVTTSRALADIIYNAVPHQYKNGRMHPATKTFMALRIAVNSELDRLQRVLASAFDLLKEGGRMGVITFHSLEDRIVKHYFRKLAVPAENQSGLCSCSVPRGVLITRKGIKASAEEIASNPPSRSAMLRVIERSDAPLDGALA